MTAPAPPDPAARLLDADREATLARQRLSSTVAELQVRLSPRKLARDAMRDATEAGQSAKRAGTDAARATADAARRNPAAIAGVVAALGVFMARGRIAHLFRRRPKSQQPATVILPVSYTDDLSRTDT